jgi:hypothetical protein
VRGIGGFTEALQFRSASFLAVTIVAFIVLGSVLEGIPATAASIASLRLR